MPIFRYIVFIVFLILGVVLQVIKNRDSRAPIRKLAATIFELISFSIALISLLYVLPQPMITFSNAGEAAGYTATIECSGAPPVSIHYHINNSEEKDILYEGSFQVDPGDTVYARASTLFGLIFSEDHEKLDVDGYTVRVTAVFRDDDRIDLESPKLSEGENASKTVPLSNQRVRVIDNGTVCLAVSSDDLRALARMTDQVDFIITTHHLSPKDVTDLEIQANGQSVEYIFEDMILYVPHAESDPCVTVAERVESGSAFELGAGSVIRGSVANVNGLIAIPLDGPAKLRTVNKGKNFNDAPASTWAEEAVRFASSHEILNGDGNGAFSPHSLMTRASFVVALHNLECNTHADSQYMLYSDVPDWCADAVTWATHQGIVNGIGDYHFGPYDPITREQFALMLWRYAGGITSDEQDALKWTEDAGIMRGTGTDAIAPGDYVTREEAAVMLMRFCELKTDIKIH